MRSEVVLFLSLDEVRRLLGNFDLVLRRAFGDLGRAQTQMDKQIPEMLRLVFELAQHLPKSSESLSGRVSQK